jgi:vancomycin resistance protein YoaR
LESIGLLSFSIHKNLEIMNSTKMIIPTAIIVSNILLFPVFDVQAFDTVQLMVDGKSKEQITLADLSSFTTKESFLTHDPAYTTEIENFTRCTNTLEPCIITTTTREKYTTRNITNVAIDENAITTFIEDIARKINSDPINAKLRFNTDKNSLEEIEPHADGINIDTTASTQKIVDLLLDNINALPPSLELAFDKVTATITSENAKELGITELIGEGISDFRGSTQSRIHNISTASKRFDGLVIAPNEEFSFVSVLGPVDGEHGYKEELVIRDNETKPEYGGGICQVSTTVFRGAIFSGMKITQRRNHSYPVHYYTPTGFDATVYVPAPDFRFINNTPGHILLNMEMEGTKLIFRYFGTDDGRSVDMQGPFVTERQDNGAMKTYFTQKVTDKNGATVIDDIFKSNYKSPDDYPHPGDVAKLTSKPDNWSKKQWKEYQAEHGL